MRLEEILSIDNNQIVTESGIKTAIGNAPHEVGDMVWVDGSCVFGNKRNSQPVVCGDKFEAQLGYYIIVGPDSDGKFIILNTDTLKAEETIDSSPDFAAYSIAFCYNAQCSKFAWFYLNYNVPSIEIYELSAETGKITKQSVTFGWELTYECHIMAYYDKDTDILEWRIAYGIGSVDYYGYNPAIINHGPCELKGDTSDTSYPVYKDYEYTDLKDTYTDSTFSSDAISDITSALITSTNPALGTLSRTDNYPTTEYTVLHKIGQISVTLDIAYGVNYNFVYPDGRTLDAKMAEGGKEIKGAMRAISVRNKTTMVSMSTRLVHGGWILYAPNVPYDGTYDYDSTNNFTSIMSNAGSNYKEGTIQIYKFSGQWKTEGANAAGAIFCRNIYTDESDLKILFDGVALKSEETANTYGYSYQHPRTGLNAAIRVKTLEYQESGAGDYYATSDFHYSPPPSSSKGFTFNFTEQFDYGFNVENNFVSNGFSMTVTHTLKKSDGTILFASDSDNDNVSYSYGNIAITADSQYRPIWIYLDNDSTVHIAKLIDGKMVYALEDNYFNTNCNPTGVPRICGPTANFIKDLITNAFNNCTE